MMINRYPTRRFLLAGLLFFFALSLHSQVPEEPQASGDVPAGDGPGEEILGELFIDMDAVDADDAFMSGVRSFHDGEYANALLSFERSLSFKPDRPLTWLWLGNSYYRLGLPDLAISQWQRVLETSYATAALRDRVDALVYQKSLGPELAPESRFVEVDSLNGKGEEATLFLGPTSVLPGPDGGSYIVSFASNEVVFVSINGIVERRIRGGLEGLNRPFDAVLGPDGRLFISEYKGDRIVSLNSDGTGIVRFGGKGRREGELLGPQFLAFDSEGYLYVSEQGNRRISKFDREGNFILSFGSKSGSFPGFREPTGLTVLDGVLYVADGRRKAVYRFDPSGNYLGKNDGDLFSSPEGLRSIGEGKILVADTERLLLYDPGEETTEVLVEALPGSKMVNGDFDVNGNLVVSDFSRNALVRYADFNQLYGSMVVRIDRVLENRFPRVVAEVSVSSRRGEPMIGMESINFLVTENRIEAADVEFLGSVDGLDDAAVSVIVEQSPAAETFVPAFAEALSALGSESAGRFDFSFVEGGAVPVRAVDSTDQSDPLIEALLRGAGKGSTQWQCDTSIRLAASGLVDQTKKRSIVLFASGIVPSDGFSRYELVEIARFLDVNHIRFYVVYPGTGDVPAEYSYLAEKSGGEVLSLFRPQGLGDLAEDILSDRRGRYLLEYTSRLDDDLGRNYLPVEVQAFLYGQSGRGETGYYAPLR